jgi:hypothetical protein
MSKAATVLPLVEDRLQATVIPLDDNGQPVGYGLVFSTVSMDFSIPCCGIENGSLHKRTSAFAGKYLRTPLPLKKFQIFQTDFSSERFCSSFLKIFEIQK